MKVTLQYAERQMRHWTKKVQELRLTSNASDAKEDGKTERSPRTPLKEKREKENKERETRTREFSIPSESEVAEYVDKTYHAAIDVKAFLAYNKVRIWNRKRRHSVKWRDVVDLWISIKGFVEKPKTLDAAQCAEYADDLKRIEAKYGRESDE